MVTTKKTLDGIEYEVGSGNVFADLGLPDPEELMAKAHLSIAIECAIDDRGLSHPAAANLLHCTEVELCGLFRGDFSEFSMDRLFRFLNALGMDARIEVKPNTREAPEAHVLVTLPEMIGADL
ncbi:MAG TPA: helix-turn-helix transcriptional regulator [Longimicrobium sp.]|jgi:predicted XRE-type DNA-binding protein